MTDKTIIIDGKEVPIVVADCKTTYRCKKTGAIYQTKEDALNFGVKLEDLAQDVVAKLPKLDLFNDLK